jgi:hypothetical protein
LEASAFDLGVLKSILPQGSQLHLQVLVYGKMISFP